MKSEQISKIFEEFKEFRNKMFDLAQLGMDSYKFKTFRSVCMEESYNTWEKIGKILEKANVVVRCSRCEFVGSKCEYCNSCGFVINEKNNL